MRYLSVFSGIEAATVAWQDLGWELAGVCEIEPFPCSALTHHYPNVKNYGDITKYKEWDIERGSIDLIVGGSPCQAFSTAGLRKGLEDPRGNLTLVFLGLIDHLRPQWIVWENVPGVLSDKTGALRSLLDGLSELGYCIDIDILNAEHFGVPQRRRRVFICAELVDTTIRSKTHTSLLTMTQCMLEILQSTLKLQKSQSGLGQRLSDSEKEFLDGGLQKRMSLFGLLGQNDENKTLLLNNLTEMLVNSPNVQKNLDAFLGDEKNLSVMEDLALSWRMDKSSLSTDMLLHNLLADLLQETTTYITSTSTSLITTRQTFTCLALSLVICDAILSSSNSYPNYLNVASLSLTLIKDYTEYARQTSREVFIDPQWIYPFDFLLKRATEGIASVGHSSGDWRRGAEVLFESTCLQGNPKKGRTKRKNTPTTTQRGVAVSDSQGRAGNQSLTDAHQVDATNQSFVVGEKGVPYRKSARAQSADGYETWVEGDVSNTINCYDVGDIRSTNISVHVYENHPNDSRVKDMGDVCSTVTSRWGTGGGNVPIVNHATMYTRADDTKITTSKNFIVHRPSDNISNTINTGNHMTPEDVLCIEPIDKVYAFEPGSIARNAGPAGLSEQCPTLRASMGDNQPAVLYTDAIPIQDVREVQKSQNGLGVGDVDSPAYTVDTRATQGVAQAQCFLHQTAGDMRGLDLRDKAILMSHQQTSVMYNMIVRRLTPVESLRLQGFPDDYLDVLHNGRKPGDNAVFKAIGNSMATPVMKYIGQRIQMSIDKHSKQT